METLFICDVHLLHVATELRKRAYISEELNFKFYLNVASVGHCGSRLKKLI